MTEEIKRHLPRSVEYQSFKKIRLYNILGLFLIIGIIFGGILFIYKDIYITFDEAYELLIIKSDLNFEPINFQVYEKVKKNWEEKSNQTKIEQTNDPFHLSITSSTNSSSIKKEQTGSHL